LNYIIIFRKQFYFVVSGFNITGHGNPDNDLESPSIISKEKYAKYNLLRGLRSYSTILPYNNKIFHSEIRQGEQNIQFSNNERTLHSILHLLQFQRFKFPNFAELLGIADDPRGYKVRDAWCSSPVITRTMKPRSVRWTWHVLCAGKSTNASKR
jgi:hypothetical protein